VIKAVILDLGNVVVPLDFRRCYGALSEVCSYPPEDVPRRIRATGLVERFETGQISPNDFFHEVCGILNMNVTYPQFCEIWSSIFAPEALIPESLLQGLCRDRRLVALSNTNAMHFPMLQGRYPLLRHFHSFVLSYEVGALKPSPRMYREAIAQSGCLAEECFFTDDIADYVDAARREGIDAVQFQSREQLERDLRERGIVC
jgi:FMN phosphatase YigB (HAD superfamily)